MGKRSGLAISLGIVLAVCAHVTATAGMEPESLRLERTLDTVRLGWNGDEPAYVIYRSSDPFGVNAPANEVRRTSDTVHHEALLGTPCVSCFYLVLPAHWFACGGRTCSVDTEYCLTFFPGVPEVPPQTECLPIPGACLGAPACSCIQREVLPPPGSSCSQRADGAIALDIFAP